MVNAVEFNQTKLFLIKNENVSLSDDDRPIVKRLKPSSDEAQYDKFYSLYAFDEIGYQPYKEYDLRFEGQVVGRK